jgi:hypothetical protein
VLTAAQAPDVREAAKLATQWAGVNVNAVADLVGTLGDGSPLNDWLDEFVSDSVQVVKDTLIDGVARGIGPEALGRALAKATDLPLHRAMTLSRTETMRAFRSASLASFEANSDIIAGYERHAFLSASSCLSCIATSGQFYPLGVPFSEHPRGRCVPIPVLKNSPLLGHIETGEEWFNKQPEKFRRESFPVGLRGDYDAGRVTLGDMAHLHTNDVWGNSYQVSTIGQARKNAAARLARGAEPKALAKPLESIEAQAVSVPKFKTTKEAHAWAQANLQTPIDGLTGADVDVVQNVMRIVKDAETRTGKAIPARIEFGGIKGKAYGQFDGKTGVIHYRKRYQDVEAAMKADDAEWIRRVRGDIPFHSTTSLDGLTWHEIAHAYDKASHYGLRREISALPLEVRRGLLSVSGYSGEDFSVGSVSGAPPLGEAFAEAFAAVLTTTPNHSPAITASSSTRSTRRSR